jgi:flagellar basal-body rod protein FlgB
MDFFKDVTLTAMESYMTRLSKRQQIVASNIANIDTPGYKTKDISFHATMEELLSDHPLPLKVSRPEHNPMGELNIAPLEPEVFEPAGLPTLPDRNNVDLDNEMIKLSQTASGYTTIAQLLRSKFKMIASSITEGR